MLEHVSLSMNPRGTLYRNRSLIEITDASGNVIAANSYRRRLYQTQWAVYRVRRLYIAGKDKDGRVSREKKGNAIRAVEQMTEASAREAALEHLHNLSTSIEAFEEHRGILYAYRQRCGPFFPTREEFLVVAPAVVETKARYGLDWIEEKWSSAQGCLFPVEVDG